MFHQECICSDIFFVNLGVLNGTLRGIFINENKNLDNKNFTESLLKYKYKYTSRIRLKTLKKTVLFKNFESFHCYFAADKKIYLTCRLTLKSIIGHIFDILTISKKSLQEPILRLIPINDLRLILKFY